MQNKASICAIAVLAALLFLVRDCVAQEPTRDRDEQPPQDHSCTVHAAASFVIPEGNDGQNFDRAGWGFQAGGGFAVSRTHELDRGWRWFITATFAYDKFKANAKALAKAKLANPTQLADATAAHAAFSAITLDLTPRYTWNRRLSFYGLGGFGWLRRGVGFNGANPATLLQSNGLSLDRVASSSGVFDAAVGADYGLTRKGGIMLFVEGRVYRGMAVNGGSTEVPLSIGLRW
jgi:hypothetical protein